MLKKGFTLAEVLVTLGIVGVIAAFTLPALMSNFQKRTYETGIKKAYNTVTDAVALYMANEGIDNLSDAPFVNNQEELQKFVKKYFKVATNCETRYYNPNGLQCFSETIYSLDKSVSSSLRSYQCMSVVTLTDGMSMCIDAGKMENATDSDGSNVGSSNLDYDDSRVLVVEVDVNGIAGPNVTGRDIFTMDVNNSGLVYDKEWDPTKKDSILQGYKSKAWPMGIGRIQYDGWKMEY